MEEQVFTSMLLTRTQVAVLLNGLNEIQKQGIVVEDNILTFVGNSFGEQLRQCRVARHIEVQDIAKATNYSSAMITRIENGERECAIQKLSSWVSALGYDGFKVIWKADAEWFSFEGVNDHFTCSKCGVITKKAEEFCPNCGAKMCIDMRGNKE